MKKQTINKPRIKLSELHNIKHILRQNHLNTVCENAKCPNISDCFHRQRATFLILGTVCTRACKFCNIGKNKKQVLAPDPEEPRNIAVVASKLKLKHIVITSVTRDDLADEGANQFSKTIRELRKVLTDSTIEVLTPDFNGKKELLDIVLNEKPDIFNHNLETVKSLTPLIRSKANYQQSLEVLKYAKSKNIITKSGIMLGLGETLKEIKDTIYDLKQAGIDILTIGQYYPPSQRHYPLKKLYTKEEFDEIRDIAQSIGIRFTFSGANVRSSYMAEETFERLRLGNKTNIVR